MTSSRSARDHRYNVSEKGRARRRAADARYEGTVGGLRRRLNWNAKRRATAIGKD